MNRIGYSSRTAIAAFSISSVSLSSATAAWGRAFGPTRCTILICESLARAYNLPVLAKTDVVIGFNGSEKLGEVAPTIEEIAVAFKDGHDPELIWRTALLRAIHSFEPERPKPSLSEAILDLARSPQLYAQTLKAADDSLTRRG